MCLLNKRSAKEKWMVNHNYIYIIKVFHFKLMHKRIVVTGIIEIFIKMTITPNVSV